MLAGTEPDLVKLCLDAHWIYQGCGNSEVAVFDILTIYHSRIVELHLRQSSNGVWNESFSMEGDISYTRVCNYLLERSIEPYIVLEQAVEDSSPNTLTSVEAHCNGRKTVGRYLADASVNKTELTSADNLQP